MSLSRTVMTSLVPSMSTWPKNCMPALGGRFTWPASGAFTNTSSGPNVSSSSLGPNVPALSGPLTNSQNGAKSWYFARFGS